jgi:hypothetical protein
MIETVYAVDTAHVMMEGGASALVRKGDHWPADDPVVRTNPQLFSRDPRYGMRYTVEPTGYDDPPVEQATAAPGEKRNTRRG